MERNIFNILKKYDITKEKLDALSIETTLDVPLNKDLNHFRKEDVIKELKRVTALYWEIVEKEKGELKYRIKSMSSIERKFNKYVKVGRNFRKVYDDILGFRILVDSYDFVLKSDCREFKIINLLKGKKNDDGYRGIHLYYQKNTKCYPIEIQIFTEKDKTFNHYLHEYIYKRNIDPIIGNKLKSVYDSGKIKNNKDFEEALSYVLRSSKKI